MAIDVIYEGTVLARETKMVSTPNGTFVEMEAPMPVGTRLTLSEGDVSCAVRVERVHEGVGPGVFVVAVAGGAMIFGGGAPASPTTADTTVPVSTGAPESAPAAEVAPVAAEVAPVAAEVAPVAAAVAPVPAAAELAAAGAPVSIEDEVTSRVTDEMPVFVPPAEYAAAASGAVAEEAHSTDTEPHLTVEAAPEDERGDERSGSVQGGSSTPPSDFDRSKGGKRKGGKRKGR